MGVDKGYRKLLAVNFLSYDIESPNKDAFIEFVYQNNKYLVL
jgi:hypothetical protein